MVRSGKHLTGQPFLSTQPAGSSWGFLPQNCLSQPCPSLPGPALSGLGEGGWPAGCLLLKIKGEFNQNLSQTPA